VPTQDLRDASPITFVHPGFPPSCFCHGVEDIQLSCVGSITIQQALSRVGAVSDLHLFSTYSHALWRIKSLIEPLMDVVAPFLDRTMVDPKPYAAEIVDFWASLPPGFGHAVPAEYTEVKIPGRSG
jgi:hypothetical protein